MILRKLIALLTPLLLLSCTAGPETANEAPASAAGPAMLLPALSLLEAGVTQSRGTSYSEADLFRIGEQFEASLPNANVSGDEGLAVFSPSFNEQAPALSALSFAIYRIDAEGYDLSGEVRLIWDAASPAQDCWIALADWQLGRWSYFEADEKWRISPDSLAPFMKDGRLLYAAVIVGGTTAVWLTEVRLGPLPPQAILSASPRSGDSPLSVSFDASASLAGEGSITKYEWDFDNDGSFELDGGLSPLAEHVYGGGQHQAALRVTNSHGLTSSVLSEAILADDPGWQHSYGRVLADEFRDMLIASDGSIYLCGDSREPHDSQRSMGTLLKLDQQGDLIWARGYLGGASINITRMAEDEAGNIVCCGVHRYSPDPPSAMVMRWNPAGEVLQSHVLQRPYSVYLTDVFPLPGQLLISGYCDNPGNNYNFFAALLEDDFELLWSRDEGAPLAEISTGAELIRDSTGTVEGLAAYGYDNDNGVYQPVLLKLDLGGEPQDYLLLDSGREAGESALSRRIEYVGTAGGAARYCLSGSFTGGDEQGAFIVNMALAGSSAGTSFSQPARPLGISAGSSDLFVCGSCAEDLDEGWFSVLSLPELFLKESYSFSAGEYVVFNAAAEVAGGRLFCGGAQSVPLLQQTLQGMQGLPLSASWLSGGDTASVSSTVTMATLPLESSDIAPELSIDIPAGESEMVVCFQAVPDLP